MNEHVLYFLLAIMLSTSLNTIHGITFYPYGNDTNDQQLPSSDDYTRTFSLPISVRFFGQTFTELLLSTNGVIGFGTPSLSNSPTSFPATGTTCVAPYWADCDPSYGGKIFYRHVQDANLLASISSEIRYKQIGSSSYSSTWAFIVTFDSVPRYGCSGSSSCSQVVTHQTILTGNRFETFAIILYEKLGFGNAQIGINAGDGRTYITLPYSNTNLSSIYPLQNSNIGEPGKWMFKISNCTTEGGLKVSPMKVLYFGGQKVSVTGICFESLETIKVKFGQIAVNCSIKDEEIVCISPYIDTIGRVTVSFEHDSRSYTGFIITHDESDDNVKVTKIDLLIDSFDSSFYFTWKETLETNILLSGMQEDIALDANWNVVSLNRRQISMEIPNTGDYKYFPDQFQIDRRLEESVGLKIRKIYLSINTTVFRRIIVSSVIEDACSAWYKLQPNKQEIKRIVGRESRKNPCQSKIVFPPLDFEVDDTCQSLENSWCSFFHPGAKTCYRSINNPSGVGVQCCYNEDNHLMIGPSGGGTLNMQDPKQSEFWHFIKDVLPYLLCCKLQSKCNRYYEKRPSINSTFFTTPAVARAHGDPHFTTVDGTSYDFNPVGEYIFLQAPDLMVQARMSSYGSLGSYFSAFAIASSGSEVVQFTVYYGTLRVTYGNTILYTGIWSFETISLNISNSTLALVQTPHGFMMQVQYLSEMLHVIVILSQNLKGKVYGLIGNWDDNPINDLMLPNKTFISTRSSTRNIHYSFGLQWTTTENTSIFLYENFYNWWSYQNTNFTPFFSIPSKYYMCNNDSDCNFDYEVTGSTNIALANINIKQNAKDIQKMYKEISVTCIVNVSIANGFVDVNCCLCDLTRVDYKFGCNPGYSLQGSQTVKCSKGIYSDEFASCYEFEGLPNHGSAFDVGLKDFVLLAVFLLMHVFL